MTRITMTTTTERFTAHEGEIDMKRIKLIAGAALVCSALISIPSFAGTPCEDLASLPLDDHHHHRGWTGAGSTDEATNFVCVDGQQDAADFRITEPGSD